MQTELYNYFLCLGLLYEGWNLTLLTFKFRFNRLYIGQINFIPYKILLLNTIFILYLHPN